MKLHDYLASGADTQTSLAGKLGFNNSVLVNQWTNGVRRVPAEHCPRIERITGGSVRCEDLRPDVEWLRINGKVFRLVDDRCCERDPVEQVA